MRILVTGSNGFIGSHLVRRLLADGHRVVGADIHVARYWDEGNPYGLVANLIDLRDEGAVKALFDTQGPFDRVYHLAANMGGIGFIEDNRVDIVQDNTRIDLNVLRAAEGRCKRLLFSSSACVYPAGRQDRPDVAGLKEDEAYPAQPEDGYGWQKLYTEELCRYASEEGRLDTRIVRFHNVFGPHGAWCGGREKAPAALCRKIAEASPGDDVEIWGDGQQTRSFLYIDDCIEGLLKIMEGPFQCPLNLGQDRMVTINELLSIIENIASTHISRIYNTSAPLGVRGRNSDNTLVMRVTGWTPKVSLEEGLSRTYDWIAAQVARHRR